MVIKFGASVVTTLLYRGQKYLRNGDLISKKLLELTYKSKSNQTKQEEISLNKSLLTYRGNNYYRFSGKEKISQENLDNQRQKLFSLTRQLVKAQFELADVELARRLWQEVADNVIDPERVINLMYRCSSYDDDVLLKADMNFLSN